MSDPALTLHYEFARNKNLVASRGLGPTLDFTRASTATFFDSAGVLRTAASGVARFDHDPVTGSSLGLFVEEARTNLLLHSEDNGINWTTVRATAFQNIIAAPDGAITANILVENTGGGTHYQTQITPTHASAAVVTISCYVKAASRSIVALFEAGANQGLFFNLTDSTTAVFTNLPTNSSITDVGNGWFRISITVTSTGTTSDIRIFSSTNMTTASHTGDGLAAFMIWGDKFEEGAFLTSYNPTTTVPVTRNADVVNTTDMTWFNPNAGTIFATIRQVSAANQDEPIIDIGDGTNDNRFLFKRRNINDLRFTIRAGGVLSANLTKVSVLALDTPISVAMAYAVDDFESFVAGARTGTGNQLGALPTGIDALGIGSRAGEDNPIFNGHISEVRYYNVRKDNQFLEDLSNGLISEDDDLTFIRNLARPLERPLVKTMR